MHAQQMRSNIRSHKGPYEDALGLFDADILEAAMLFNGHTGRRALYALPMGRLSNHLHIWKSLLERAGFTLANIPREWDAFWSFWCDRVQPAVWKALGRDDVWGVGLPMSVVAVSDTQDQLVQFQLAYGTSWIGRDRRLQVDDPGVRSGLVRALAAYTAIWRQGCIPSDALSWTNSDNNKASLERRVGMTPNPSLSIPAALREARPVDYYGNCLSTTLRLAS
jgi:multiple sugar transport system substrate-binding protein